MQMSVPVGVVFFPFVLKGDCSYRNVFDLFYIVILNFSTHYFV